MSEPHEPKLVDLVGAVYEAALDAKAWPGLLGKMSSVVHAEAGTVWMHDFADSSADLDAGGGNLAAFVGIDDSAMADYASHYSGLNVWAANEDTLGSGSTVTSSMLYPDSLLKRTEFYGDFLLRQDLFYALGGVVDKQGTRAVKLSLLRPEGAGSFGSDELHVMRQLMPHLQTAVALHRKLHRLEALAAGALEVLDLVRFGVVLLTRAGTLLHANRAAIAVATHTAALHFGPGGTLRAVTPQATHRLQALIRGAVATGAGLGTSPGGALRLPGPNGRSLQVVVAPLPASSMPFGHSVPAALFCSDPDATIAGLTATLQQLYAMSPAEAVLTEALVNGKSLKEFAEQRQTSMNTVRTQLKCAAAKAGAKRQADLVRVVLTGPAVWRRG